MDPITNSKLSDDFHKFVLQDQNSVPLINPHAKPPKPFNLKAPEKSNKSKKHSEKDTSKEK